MRAASSDMNGGTGDADLVGRVLAGERECYSTLVRRYQDDLYRYAAGMGVDHDTALDLVQDAFVRAYQGIASCRDPARFRFWVLRILRNRCLDHMRSVRERSLPLEALPPTAAADADASPELGWMIEDALGRLPATLREAFLLKHGEGLSYDEMADVTGASVSALKMRVHRAREALQLALEDADVFGAT